MPSGGNAFFLEQIPGLWWSDAAQFLTHVWVSCRLDEAIEILEHVVRTREEKLGTANTDVDDEKSRLFVLLKEAGRSTHRRSPSLEVLLGTSTHLRRKGGIVV